MKPQIFYILAFLIPIICSCNSKPKECAQPLKEIVIHIGEKDIIKPRNSIEDVETIFLHMKENTHMSSIQEFCLSDSLLFVLDKMNNIFKFNIKTGAQVDMLHKLGHGHGEYIDAKAICYSRGDIYILDFQGMAVHLYTNNFEYVKTIRIDFPALDFCVLKDGFLFYNLNADSQKKRIVHTDLNGKFIDCFLDNSSTPDLLAEEDMFSTDENGITYFSDPVTNIIYQWDNNALKPIYAIKTNNSLIKKEPLSGQIFRSLITNQLILTPYIDNQFVLTNIYDRDKETSQNGIVNTSVKYPFKPQIIVGDELVGLYETDERDYYQENAEFILVKYKLE